MKYIYLIGIALFFSLSCNSQQQENKTVEKKHQYTNALVNETSPYLLPVSYTHLRAHET